MFNKRVLIYHDVESLAPIGGPCGYLNSLYEGLKGYPESSANIFFLKKEEHDSRVRRKPINNRLVNWVKPIYRALKHYRYIRNILTKTTDIKDLVKDYDAVHFHTTMDMYLARNSLKNYPGKIILTSHSPEPLSAEIIDNGYPLEKRIFSNTYRKLIEMDLFAFSRADYIIFPCESADEPYLNKWPRYKTIKDNSIDKYRYLLTGTIPARITYERDNIRKKYGIPEDAFVICYVGRHNRIKGFERLKTIGKRLLSDNPNVYFLIGGKEEPLCGIKHDRWIEIGWTDEPHSLTNAADVFILPNLETYFDLILLEVLSVGTPIIASNTGGNKYFNGQRGVLLFDNESGCIEQIKRLMRANKDELAIMKEANKDLYKTQFTPSAFAKNYLDLLSSILE